MTARVLAALLDSGNLEADPTLVLSPVIEPGAMWTFTATVPAGAASFAAAIASREPGNLDLLVKLGAPPTTSDFDLVSSEPNTLDLVELEGDVPAGVYHVAIVNSGPVAASTYASTAHAAGLPRASRITGALLFAIHTQTQDGPWGLGLYNPGEPRVTCEVLEVLVRLGLGGLPEVGVGLGWVAASQGEGGGFGRAGTTATCLSALAYAGGYEVAVGAAHAALLAAQRPDGSFEGDVQATARALAVLAQVRRLP